MMKVCTLCHVVKPHVDFYKCKATRDGYKSRCMKCINALMLEYSRLRYSTTVGRAKQMFNNAKSRSKKYNIDFNICPELIHFLLLLGVCQKSGIPFDLTPSDNSLTNPFAPGLDRINAQKGYVYGNVQVVCNMFNMGKSDHDELDFIAMCVAVAENHSDKPKVIARLKELRNAIV